MPTIGVDCQVIIDGAGYFVEPNTYLVRNPRLRKATITKGGAERYVDAGPGKREWEMTLLCVNELVGYGATSAPLSKALRDALRTSYARTGTISFTDVEGTSHSVHFDDYTEHVRDPRTQLTSPSYHVSIILVEA
jgi:hypothetical protein